MTFPDEGAVYWANLDPVQGHEQSGLRPVLVLQNNILNRSIDTVVIVPLTSNMKPKGFMSTHFLPKKDSLLPYDSIALLFQIRAIDKRRLNKMAGRISLFHLMHLRQQLMFVF